MKRGSRLLFEIIETFWYINKVAFCGILHFEIKRRRFKILCVTPPFYTDQISILISYFLIIICISVYLISLKKSAGLLCNIQPTIYQGTLDNLPLDEGKTGGNNNVVLQKVTDNSTEGASYQRGSPKENSNKIHLFSESRNDSQIHITTKKSLENLIITRHIEAKIDKRRQWAF